MKKLEPMTAYEARQLCEINDFKNKKPSVLQKVNDTLLKPFNFIVGKVIPSEAVEGALKGANCAARWTVDRGDILRDGGVTYIDDLRYKDLRLSDSMANEVHNWAIGTAMAEGAATGAFGLPGMVVDVPALITMALRVINKIALCYGYECDSEYMQAIVLHIFSVAGANTMEDKYSGLLAIRRMQVIIAKESWKQIMAKGGQKMGDYAFITLIRQIAKQLGVNLTKRKALQSIPYVGGAIGGSVNGVFIKDIGWAARRVFQEMWLIENNKILPDVTGTDYEDCA